jgi:glucosamine--fructose-6-phosphate aminotransferase (isomerizing)
VSADPSLLAHDLAQQPALLRHLPDLGPARALVERHRVVRLVGIGSSRHVAAYGGACLETLHGTVATVLPAPGEGVPQPRLGADDLLVVVSQSGATPALLDLARTARAAGSAVLAVTNVPGSPLEDLADAVLPCDAGEEAVVPATKSVTTAMLRLRALASAVPDDLLAALAEAVQDQVTARHPLPERPPGFVVAGGLAGQAVAEETALKLAEVAGLAAVPESLVDFLHGPAAVHAPVLALLDDADPNAAALAGLDVHRVRVQTTGDPALDQLVRVVAGQCLALAWARRTGVDPDDPKGLAKVTRTR